MERSNRSTSLVAFVLAGAFLAVLLPSLAPADEIDDLLTKRANNYGHIKRLHVEMTIDVQAPPKDGKETPPGQMKMAYTLKQRDKKYSNPFHRYDVDMSIDAPYQMKFKVEDGQFSFLTNGGQWEKRDLPDSARKFLEEVPDKNGSDPASVRAGFDVKRRKDKDNLWGSRKGVEFVPKGKSKLYSSRVEVVDSDTGEPAETEYFDDKGKRAMFTKVTKFGNHNGFVIAEETESESETISGKVLRKVKITKVEYESDEGVK